MEKWVFLKVGPTLRLIPSKFQGIIEFNIQYHLKQRLSHESIKLSWFGWDFELTWANHLNCQKNLGFNSKIKFFLSFQIIAKEHNTTVKTEKSLKNQWFSLKGKVFHNPWLKTHDEKDNTNEALKKFSIPMTVLRCIKRGDWGPFIANLAINVLQCLLVNSVIVVTSEKYQVPCPPLTTILSVGLLSLSTSLCATKEAGFENWGLDYKGVMYSLIVLNANICDMNCMVIMCYFIVLNINVI